MKKFLLAIIVVGLVGLTGCGTVVNTTEEKTEVTVDTEPEVETNLDSLCEQTVEETDELIEDVENIYSSMEASEEFRQYCTEEEWNEFLLMCEYFN